MSATNHNWAGNYQFQASAFRAPHSLDQLQSLIAANDNVHLIGSGHSFNDIADSQGVQISLSQLEPVMYLDRQTQTVTVSAGTRYGELAQYLNENGFALPNLASLPHISVVGACATATHGSGNSNGNLSTAIVGLKFIAANGDLITLRQDFDDEFAGAVVNLGGLGAIVAITLAIVPTYEVRQFVYRNLSWPSLWEDLAAVMGTAYSVSLFTNWVDPAVDQVWLKFKSRPWSLSQPFYDATAAKADIHPLATWPATPCTEQLGVPGPWHRRLPHFKLEFTPSAGDELQSEYLLPLTDGVEALRAMRKLGPQIAPYLHVSEIRTIAADNLWLSTAYDVDSLAIHFTWKADWPNVRQLLPIIEEALAPFRARPHWGKLFTTSSTQIQQLYERLPAFRELLHQFDPAGKFRNRYLERILFEDANT